MIGVPILHPSREAHDSATSPGTFALPATILSADDGSVLTLSDDQLTAAEIRDELRANRALLLALLEALNARMTQLHVLQMARLGLEVTA